MGQAQVCMIMVKSPRLCRGLSGSLSGIGERSILYTRCIRLFLEGSQMSADWSQRLHVIPRSIPRAFHICVAYCVQRLTGLEATPHAIGVD